MPSPTSSTRPTSRDSSLVRYWSISVFRTETISSALNLMAAFHQDLVFQLFEPGAHRAVVDPVADLNDHPAQQVGIHFRFEHRLAVNGFTKFAPKLFGLFGEQRRGRQDLNTHTAGPLFEQ